MLNAIARTQLHDAGWIVKDYDKSKRASYVQSIVATHHYNTLKTRISAIALGAISIIGGAILGWHFREFGVIPALAVGFVACSKFDQSSAMNTGIKTSEARYLSSTKELYYIKNFKKTLEAQQNALTQKHPEEKRSVELNKITTAWSCASSFFNALPSARYEREIKELTTCQTALLSKDKETKNPQDVAEAITTCLNRCLDPENGIITQICQKQLQYVDRSYRAFIGR